MSNSDLNLNLDYKELGLKVGLEIHQQLNTSRKLFCNCPTKIRDDEPHGEIERVLRPSQSEMGQIDKAALIESKKEKNYVYQYYNDSTCLVELDDEPPQGPCEEGIYTAVEVSELMNMHVVDDVQVMRKMVIDGSNTSGFQRTMFVSQDGSIETEYGDIRITSLCLEEDACKKVRDEKDKVIYCVDRLGIPLLEITTEPDITTPEMGKEAARRIGTILRATGKAKRGLGTIRQDVNISIKEGARIEVKGVQNLDLIEQIIKNEAIRQIKLNEIKKELIERNAEVKTGIENIVDVSELFKNTESKVIKSALKKKGVVKAILLKGFDGLIGKEVQPNRRLGTEFSDRGKVIGGVGGLFHTDELPKYGITQEEVDALKEFMGVNPETKDAVIIVGDREDKAVRALGAVLDRANEAITIGIPEETRKALEDGNTSYLRPLPGAARMYPETDIPNIAISDEFVENIRNNLPEMPKEKLERFIKEYDLNNDLAKQMVMSYHVDLFEELAKTFVNVKATLIATTIEATVKEIRREGFNTEILEEKHFKQLFESIENGKVSKEAIVDVLKGFIENPYENVDKILEIKGLSAMSEEDVKKEIRSIIEQNIAVVNEKGMGAMGLLMGRCMANLRGKADGKLINKTLQDELKSIINK
ncbi:Glu-tRNA(Gln) amidotransferase subunit GatE [Methanococcus voltae]|uniref:Glutamyl-tRNA(Gln) amidotransferase subunit E n=1 Tax=Methanococcus voltae (strain ATCC BAA-1334 / A3) TaxID=456320 RepID=D7DS19_METV3|nr:Glu-tRNA(Gln) amidotransferase subunit GatE [Methanococcus voltae]MCS3901454.1 glutamyl-tRNA(Gln) amidotransferase subunit E [Methanococcus voltae]